MKNLIVIIVAVIALVIVNYPNMRKEIEGSSVPETCDTGSNPDPTWTEEDWKRKKEALEKCGRGNEMVRGVSPGDKGGKTGVMEGVVGQPGGGGGSGNYATPVYQRYSQLTPKGQEIYHEIADESRITPVVDPAKLADFLSKLK